MDFRTRAVIAGIAIWLTLSPTVTLARQPATPSTVTPSCGSYAVATAPYAGDQPMWDDVVTLHVTGQEIAHGDSPEPFLVEPSPKPGIAVVRSSDGIYSLLDVATGVVTPVSIPEEDQSQLTSTYPAFRNAPESDYMLLWSGPDAVWLVELATGSAVDLTNVGEDGQEFIDTASISPDGNWLLWLQDQQGYVLSLEAESEPVVLDSETVVAFPGFDQQSRVVYGVGSDGNTVIRRFDPTTGERTDLAQAPGVRVVPLRYGGPTLLMDAQTLWVLDDGATAPRELFTWQGVQSGLLASASGSSVLVGDEIDDIVAWQLIDLVDGSSTELADLAGMTPMTETSNRDAVLFAPSPRIGAGTIGASYRTLNLIDGTVTTVLQQDSTDNYRVIPGGDAAGRYTLVEAVSPDATRLWLVDDFQGTATPIPGTTGGNMAARVSPDGCQLAVSVTLFGEGPPTSDVTVTSLLDGSLITELSDVRFLGWAALPPKR